jgi:hypothetical protein
MLSIGVVLTGGGAPREQMTVLAGSELKDLPPLLKSIRCCSGVDTQFKAARTGVLDL